MQNYLYHLIQLKELPLLDHIGVSIVEVSVHFAFTVPTSDGQNYNKIFKNDSYDFNAASNHGNKSS